MSFREYGPDPLYPVDIYNDLEVIRFERMPILDVDRAVVDPDLAVDRLSEVAVAFGIPYGAIRESQEEVQNGGGTFEPYTTVTTLFQGHELQKLGLSVPELTEDMPDALSSLDEAVRENLLYVVRNKLLAVRRSFVEDGTTQILYNQEGDDAVALFAELQRSPSVPAALATAAASMLWQRDKIGSTGWNGYTELIPAVTVTDPVTGRTKLKTPPKGQTLDSWRGPDGNTYDFVGVNTDNRPLMRIAARHLILLDDKPVSFEGLPLDCEAEHIDRPSEAKLQSQAGELPTNIVSRVISRLGESTIAREAAYDAHPGVGQIVAFVPATRWNR